MKKLLSTLFIITGLICFISAGYLIYDRTNPNRVSFAYEKQIIPAKEIQSQRQPVKLVINTVNIELPIIPASIKDGQWESTKDGVSYLTSSPIPGEKGNSILYGHNWPNLLGKLVTIKPGDTVEITYNDGSVSYFDIEYTATVTPDQTHILAESQDKRITLYTCTGFMDSKRYVVVGILREELEAAKVDSL